MAEIASIIQFVAWGTRLSLHLYEFGVSVSSATRDVNRIAKGVSLFSVTLKQVGVSLKEEASLRDSEAVPSPEAFETVKEILNQCHAVFTEIEALVPLKQMRDESASGKPLSLIQKWKWSLTSKAKMDYLLSHLESLKLTLSVMIQTFYTARIIRWAKHQQVTLPEVEADPVQTEKQQMEILITEQQMSLLRASKLYEEYQRSEAFVLPQLLAAAAGGEVKCLSSLDDPLERTPTPACLIKYQETTLARLDPSPTESECLVLVRRVSSPYIDYLLERWTRLREIEDRFKQFEEEMEAQRRRSFHERRKGQQPTVESDDSDDQLRALPTFKGGTPRIAAPKPQAPNLNPPFSPSVPMPIPVPTSSNRRTLPLSPPSSQYGISPGSPVFQSSSQGQSFGSASQIPISPRASFHSTRSVPDATNDAKERDESTGLGIPWRLCLRSYYWNYIDGNMVNSNTEKSPSRAFTNRNAWTEIMASWVCKEAIEEARYNYTQVQKARSGQRRTNFEPCFCINQSLAFTDVERLVERTIEICDQRQHPTAATTASQTLPQPSQTPIQPSKGPIPSRPVPLERSATFSGPFIDHFGSLPTTFNTPNPLYTPFPQNSATAKPFYPLSTQQPSHYRANTRKSRTSLSQNSPSTTSDSDELHKHSRSRRSSAGGSSKRRSSSSKNSAIGTMATLGGMAALLDGLVL